MWYSNQYYKFVTVLSESASMHTSFGSHLQFFFLFMWFEILNFLIYV